MMRETYIDLMEKALSAYTRSHIEEYFASVKREGLTEHGFPRLTANIGILLSHGRCDELLPLFLDMMDFCCHSIPRVKAANDFSVREIVCCIDEIEKSARVKAAVIQGWKDSLAAIDPNTCYTVVAQTPEDKVKNWALFTATSEFFRQRMMGNGVNTFIETQIATQLQWLDENGMYMDNVGDVHQPIVYDIAPRGLFTILLHGGYRGQYYREIDECIKRAALCMLRMQSPNGEIPYGGRSNQFYHNEPWMVAIYEYEACRYHQEGNDALAGVFKAAAARALGHTASGLAATPIHHIKNRFSTETGYGCEAYAYFDKYMITVASVLYTAYQMCDDSIPTPTLKDDTPTVWATSYHFHKLFLKAGGYGLELDLAADPHYDCSGIGRVHKAGAPSAICLSVPCPPNPKYTLDIPPHALSLCPGIYRDGAWVFATDETTVYEIVSAHTDNNCANANISCHFAGNTSVRGEYSVDGNGVRISLRGEGALALMLPAFCFDGEVHPDIRCAERELCVSYRGWLCRYVTDGAMTDLLFASANRNGHYRAFAATGKDELCVAIEITPQEKP